VERQFVLRRAGFVVRPHPGDQLPVAVQLAQSVRETVAQHRVEVTESTSDELVDGQSGHPVALDGDRPEAEPGQPGEELVPQPRERRFEVRRFPVGEQGGRCGDERADVLGHAVESYR
jgi:hypothetical protein